MPTLPIIRYPLDITGTNINNLVEGEVHVMLNRPRRCVALTYGAFFTESIVVTDVINQRTLTRGVSFDAIEFYELPSVRYGKEICAVVEITDSTVSNTISVTYQAVGGEFSISTEPIIRAIEALALDNRPAEWGSIINKPDRFPPTPHLHDVGDTYGYEDLVFELQRIRAAILLGDEISHDRIYQYIDSKVTSGAEEDVLYFNTSF
jgi:hypothetical protein